MTSTKLIHRRNYWKKPNSCFTRLVLLMRQLQWKREYGKKECHQTGINSSSAFHDMWVRKDTTNPDRLIQQTLYDSNDLNVNPAVPVGN